MATAPRQASRGCAALGVALLLALPALAGGQERRTPSLDPDAVRDTVPVEPGSTAPPFGVRFARAWVGSALGGGTGFLLGAAACRSGCGGGKEDPGMGAGMLLGALGGAFGSSQGACSGMPAGCGRRGFVAGSLGSVAALGATVAVMPALSAVGEPLGVVVPFLVFTASQALVTVLFTR